MQPDSHYTRPTPNHKGQLQFDIHTGLGQIDRTHAEAVLKQLKQEENAFRRNVRYTHKSEMYEVNATTHHLQHDSNVTDKRFDFALPDTQPSLANGTFTVTAGKEVDAALLTQFLSTVRWPDLMQSSQNNMARAVKDAENEKLRKQVIHSPKIKITYDRTYSGRPEVNLTFQLAEGYDQKEFAPKIGRMIQKIGMSLMNNGSPFQFQQAEKISPLPRGDNMYPIIASNHLFLTQNNKVTFTLQIPPGINYPDNHDLLESGVEIAVNEFLGKATPTPTQKSFAATASVGRLANALEQPRPAGWKQAITSSIIGRLFSNRGQS